MEDAVDQRQHSSFQLNLTVTTFVCGILFSSTANLSAVFCYVWHTLMNASYELPIQKRKKYIYKKNNNQQYRKYNSKRGFLFTGTLCFFF